MSFLAGSIIGDLGLDTTNFTKGFLQAETLMQSFPASVTSFMASPLLGLVNVAKSVFGTISEMFNASFERADKINDLAKNIGISTESLSEFGFAAEQSGSSLEAMAEGFKFLGKNQAEAMAGSAEAAGRFASLGIALADSAGNARPLENVMMDVSDALAKLPAGGARTAAAMDLLGRSGTDLISTLSDGSDALREWSRISDETGNTITASAAKSADA
jgi:hypothetical protein